MSKKLISSQSGSAPLVLIVLTMIFYIVSQFGMMVRGPALSQVQNTVVQSTLFNLRSEVRHIFSSPSRCPSYLSELLLSKSASDVKTIWSNELKTPVTTVRLITDRANGTNMVEPLVFELKERHLNFHVNLYVTRSGGTITACSSFPPDSKWQESPPNPTNTVGSL